eukprot:EG_transcript_7619
MELSQVDFQVECLTPTKHYNPLSSGFLPIDNQRVRYHVVIGEGQQDNHLSFQVAGPHQCLHFKPAECTIGIVSCGGLCPGLNDVIKALVYQAYNEYNVRRVIGFRYGYYGLTKEGFQHSIILDQKVVAVAHLSGGSILGTSRGPRDSDEMVDTLVGCQVNVLFCIGGDGTQRGALAIANAIRRRGLDIAVVGIPKTIDNDIAFIDRSFGFDTAVQEAVKVLKAALCEARSNLYGIGLVKLMGREAGFIAAQATLASTAAQICLIPENDVSFETLCDLIELRFQQRTYCSIAVAEGFGQQMLHTEGKTDASGNRKLGDIGVYLRDRLSAWLKDNKSKYGDATVKYIDPSYTVRSCPASSNDAAFCVQLANCALHEGMHGSTNCVVGFWVGSFTAVPIELAVRIPKRVDLKGAMWRSVREITVSRSRHCVGAAEEDHDCVNAALCPPAPRDGPVVHRLWKRVQDLHRVISTVHAMQDGVKRKKQRLEEEAAGQASNATDAAPSEGMLEHLECKYSQMKERLYK